MSTRITDVVQILEADPTMKQDEVFWFEDGTVILEAGNVQFKVYRGMLSHHSSVFAEMFSHLPPLAPSNALDECPVIRVDDTPENISGLLSFLLPWNKYVESLLLLSAVEINFAFCRQTNGLSKIYPPYHRLSSQVRLSHKYQMPSFLSLALQYLKRHFTTTFDEWTKVNYVPHPFTGVEAIGVVNIARHVGCDSILPTAFLACCNLDTDVLIGGFVCADGTREKLSEADLARCITGKIALLEELNAAVIRVCTTRENAMAECRCERAKPEVLRFFAEGKPRGACDPFLDCDTYLRLEARHGPRSTLSMCAKCRRTIAAQFREEQRDIWKRLPRIFDIEVNGWE